MRVMKGKIPSEGVGNREYYEAICSLTYMKEADMAYFLLLPNVDTDDSEVFESSDNIIFDFAEDGALIGFELVGVSRITEEELLLSVKPRLSNEEWEAFKGHLDGITVDKEEEERDAC